MHDSIEVDGFYHPIEIQEESIQEKPVLLEKLYYKNNIYRTIWSDGTVKEHTGNKQSKILFRFDNEKKMQEVLEQIEAYFKQDKTIE